MHPALAHGMTRGCAAAPPEHPAPPRSILPARQGWDPLNPSDGYGAAEGREVNGKTVAAFLAPYLSNDQFKASDKARAWELALHSPLGQPAGVAALDLRLKAPARAGPPSCLS